MKVGRDQSWWVAFSWTCECFCEEDNEWCEYDDFDTQRFNCLKKDIKKTVTEHIEEIELKGEKYRNLKVKIDDFYQTTTEEI